MNYFKSGDPVITVINGRLVHAKVASFYPQISTAIVVTEDGDHIKVSTDTISPEPETPKKEGVTITAEEFADISAKIVAEECAKFDEGREIILLAVSVIFGKIYTKLFGEADNDKEI